MTDFSVNLGRRLVELATRRPIQVETPAEHGFLHHRGAMFLSASLRSFYSWLAWFVRWVLSVVLELGGSAVFHGSRPALSRGFADVGGIPVSFFSTGFFLLGLRWAVGLLVSQKMVIQAIRSADYPDAGRELRPSERVLLRVLSPSAFDVVIPAIVAAVVFYILELYARQQGFSI